MRARIIPVCEPRLDGNEEKYLLRTVQTNWISSAGKYITDFENLFAEKVGAKYGVACSNGTTALHLALATLGVGPGDEVIVPTFTMIASANAVTYTGAKPVFIDSEPETYNMDVRQLEGKLSPRTKVIMPMHTYGHPVDMDPLLALAKKHDLFVLSDTAEAHGAEYKGKPIGGLDDLSTYSFYANKIITTGEGGAVTTSSDDLSDAIRRMRHHGIEPRGDFEIAEPGLNYRLSDILCAVGIPQLRRLKELLAARRSVAERYEERLREIEGVDLPSADKGDTHGWQAYVVRLDRAQEAIPALREQGIEAQIGTYALHRLAAFRDQGEFPGASAAFDRAMALPFHTQLTDDELDRVVGALAAFA
jgi:perosamine synthetase